MWATKGKPPVRRRRISCLNLILAAIVAVACLVTLYLADRKLATRGAVFAACCRLSFRRWFRGWVRMLLRCARR